MLEKEGEGNFITSARVCVCVCVWRLQIEEQRDFTLVCMGDRFTLMIPR